jgi:hypothetical protein
VAGPTSVNAWAWYKADAITGKNDGDPISQWDDSSGNARHAIQATGGSQPTYKTAIQAGLPVVRFDGAADQLEVPDASALTAGTGFIVVKIVTDPPASGKTGLWTFGASAMHFPFTDGLLYEAFGTTVRKDSIAIPDLTQWQIYEVFSGASDWGALLDGVSLHATGTNTVGFTAAPRLGHGGASFLDGDIGEAVIYDSKLSSTDRDDVRAALDAKWLNPADPPSLFLTRSAVRLA